MKRIRVFVLGLVVAVSLTACAENEEEVRQQIDLNTMQNEQALNYDTDTERNEHPVVENTKIPDSVPEVTPQPEPEVTPQPEPEVTPLPAPEVIPQPEQVTETTQNQQDNYFYNDTNNYYDLNQVSIRPRYMYWDNGVLVAECFVINGLPVNVYNINVENLEFSNGSVKIAQAAFGVMQNAVIAPYSHVIWTFYFDSNCVLSANADLTGFMNCSSNTSYNY